MLDPVARVRRFNRAVTSEVGALDTRSSGAVRLLSRPLKDKGRREDRAPADTRDPLCAMREANAQRHTGEAETTRPSLRSGLTGYAALPSETEFVLASALRKLMASINPVGPMRLRKA